MTTITIRKSVCTLSVKHFFFSLYLGCHFNIFQSFDFNPSFLFSLFMSSFFSKSTPFHLFTIGIHVLPQIVPDVAMLQKAAGGRTLIFKEDMFTLISQNQDFTLILQIFSQKAFINHYILPQEPSVSHICYPAAANTHYCACRDQIRDSG